MQTKQYDIDHNLTDAQFLSIWSDFLQSTECFTPQSLVNYMRLKGHDAKIPKRLLPADHIRNLVGISNSRLTRFKNKLQGITTNYPPRAAIFGQAFHELALEPHFYNSKEYNLRPSEITTISAMVESLEQNETWNKMKDGAKVEQSRTWSDKVTGLACKGKMDLILKNRDIVDLKSTSAKSLQQFERAVLKYDYDRQAAFYLNSSEAAKRFHFVAVQKRKPHGVFIFTFDRASDEMKYGFKKVNFLLKKWIENKEIL